MAQSCDRARQSETGVLSPGPSTNPPQPRSPTRDSWNNSWDRYNYRDKWTDVWKDGHDGNRWIHGWNEHYHGDNWTDAWRQRILALRVNTMMTTRQMRGASAKLMMSGVRVTGKRAVGARAIGRRADGTMQTSAATIAKNRCCQVIHFSRQRA